MDEVLLMVIENVDGARHANSEMEMGVRLKMASRAMRCALELYGEWSGQTVRDEETK